MISYVEYKELVDSLGGSRPFSSLAISDNYFVYYNHRIGLYMAATVNDGCEAPERLYMNMKVAYDVRNYLNIELLKET